MQTYDCKECNLLTKERLREYFDRSDFYGLTDVDIIFRDVLALIIKKGWKPVFVTVGSIPNIAAKKAWLKDDIIDNHYDATFIGLVDVKDKSSVDMSDGIMIDDHPDMLNSSNAAVKICFGEYGWNKDWEGLRAKNWKEAYKILEDLANER